MFQALGRWLHTKATEKINPKVPTLFWGSRLWKSEHEVLEMPRSDYIESFAHELGLTTGRKVHTPSVKDSDWSDRNLEVVGAKEHQLYRRMVGKAQFILPRRVDAMYATKELSRRLHAPMRRDLKAAIRLWRYLYHTRDWCLRLRPNQDYHRVIGFGDTDWAGCPETRRSTACVLVFWCNCLIY